MAGMILRALAQWSWLILARLAGIVTGLVMVALAIPFRVPAVSLSDGRAIVNLPRCNTVVMDRASSWSRQGDLVSYIVSHGGISAATMDSLFVAAEKIVA